jgi:hypothetical protein
MMRNMTRLRKWYFAAPLALVALTAFVSVGGWTVTLLWNWLVPPLFGLRTVTFWQALGLLVLCRILFGGFGGHSHHRPSLRDRWMARHDHMSPEERERLRQSMRERWAARHDPMSPEERERFRQAARERWGCGPERGPEEP